MMTQNRMDSPNQDSKFQVQGELLEVILQDEVIYPWNPADAAVEDYLQTLEDQYAVADWSEAETEARSQDFFAQLERCWPTDSSTPVVNRLMDRFGGQVPQDYLSAIAQQVETVANATLSPLERLVNCVQPLLSNWSTDDLQVFARPMAYAMRSGPGNTAVNLPKHWNELSEVEQAKYTLQIAHYALNQAQEGD
ncbi:hypothetical protein PN462_08920 [Spirulina sp. CS-785/01]|uniref:hypothetical protein n=1 Tax=Spirulina sp. CS-785/01 TaxID=3021716 RepID=UPI00232D0A8D|nr:hypothetical protein [Spirulina sp. CS-785/01]MDB9313219.1 hypothetical protein [Spirulina sp. CS-785/01]